jgi:ankyrin repeat protein
LTAAVLSAFMGNSQSSPLQMRSNHSPPLERSNTYTSQLRPTPTTFDCDLQLRKAIEENDMYEAEDWIVNEGANVNAIISPDGGTLLMLAVTIDSGSCTALLLEEGADVNARKMNGNTALMEAASRGSANCVRLLLNHGADVNGANNTGVTALMMAAIGGDVESLNYLLNSGANINAINNDANTAWMLATKFGSVECLQSLLRYEGFLDPYKVNEAINVAVSNGRYESAEVLRRHRGAGGAQRQQPPQQHRQQTVAANTPARAPPAGRFPRLFDTRSLETHPFTKSELEAMNKQEVRAVKFKLGMMG